MKIKNFFSSPKKTMITVACIVAILAATATGSVFAARAIASSTSIGEDNAKNFAFADAGIDPVSAQVVRTEFDFEQGQFVYEVEFVADGTEYEYWIKASDGSVVKKQMELVTQEGSNATVTAKITMDAAKEMALKDAGLTASEVTFTEQKIDLDDGVSVYELDFYSNTHKYEYEINANTGAVYSKSKEARPINNTSSRPAGTTSKPAGTSSQTQQPVQSGSQKISLDAAKSKALADAGVNAADTVFTKAKLDYDDGVAVYDIEFYNTATSYGYEYEINAYTGAVRSKEAEPLKGANSASSGASQISLDSAKSIALKHAGLTASEVVFSKTKLERDDGVTAYEIEFYKGRMEYEYKIHAYTGEILEFDSDWD